MYLHWWGPWWMWFYGHRGKPVWHNYRESFQLHWCNLCGICQWLRYSIRSQTPMSAPHHKMKINKKHPPHNCHSTIWLREEDGRLNTSKDVYPYTQYMTTSTFMFTAKRLPGTFCPAPKWHRYNLFGWRTSDHSHLTSLEFLTSHVYKHQLDLQSNFNAITW